MILPVPVLLLLLLGGLGIYCNIWLCFPEAKEVRMSKYFACIALIAANAFGTSPVANGLLGYLYPIEVSAVREEVAQSLEQRGGRSW